MPTRLDRLRTLDAQATPGPWVVDVHGQGARWNVYRETDMVDVALAQMRAHLGQPDPERGANADLIAAARNALPALLAVVDAAREVVSGHATGHRITIPLEDLSDALAALEEEA